MEGETRVDVLWTGFDAREEGECKKAAQFYTVPKVYFGQIDVPIYSRSRQLEMSLCKLPLIYMPCQPLYCTLQVGCPRQ